MSDVVCCPLYGCDDNTASFYEETRPTAKKEHRCCECKEAIAKGARYERTKGLWEDGWSTYKTCLSCVEIRNHFSCGEGWIFTCLWEQLKENFFPNMKAGGPCMEGLSPEAKARLFEKRLVWLGVNEQ